MEGRKLLVEVEDITDLEGNSKFDPPYHGMHGFLTYVPLISVGSVMLLMYPEGFGTRLTTTKVQDYQYDENTETHTVRTKNSIYTMRDSYNRAARKRAKATLYLKALPSSQKEEGPDPKRTLLSYGKYRTKIFPQDLPEWYVGGYMYKRHGFMSAKGVKYLHYQPSYLFDNQLYKDDNLFISYDAPIVPVTQEGVDWFDGYDHVLSGLIILDFVRAVKKYSGLEVSGIEAELERKREWYYEKQK